MGEKRDILQLVEQAALPVECTQEEPNVPRGSFCRWYRQYHAEGDKGLEPPASAPSAVLGAHAGAPIRNQIVQLWPEP